MLYPGRGWLTGQHGIVGLLALPSGCHCSRGRLFGHLVGGGEQKLDLGQSLLSTAAVAALLLHYLLLLPDAVQAGR